ANDAELILRAYECWGRGCLERLSGDFAFCVLDTKELFCARDRFGIPTLYYHDDGELFRCATEIAALFADPELSRRPDLKQVALFLDDDYTETDRTLYAAVDALPPAHCMTITARGVHIERYWDPAPGEACVGAAQTRGLALRHAR